MKNHDFFPPTFVLIIFLNININMNLLEIKNFKPLKIHCGYVEIESIVPLSIVNRTNEHKVVNNHIVLKIQVFQT